MDLKRQGDHIILKMVIVGEVNVGKSCFTRRLHEDKYQDSTTTTMVPDIVVHKIKIGEYNVKIQFWDTVGQEKYQSLTKNLFKGAHGIIFAYAIDDVISYNTLQSRLISLKNEACPDALGVIIATKCDKIKDAGDILVTHGRNLAEINSFDFYSTSAKKDSNIKEVVNDLATKIVKNFLSNSYASPDKRCVKVNLNGKIVEAVLMIRTNTVIFKSENKKSCC